MAIIKADQATPRFSLLLLTLGARHKRVGIPHYQYFTQWKEECFIIDEGQCQTSLPSLQKPCLRLAIQDTLLPLSYGHHRYLVRRCQLPRGSTTTVSASSSCIECRYFAVERIMRPTLGRATYCFPMLVSNPDVVPQPLLGFPSLSHGAWAMTCILAGQ